MSFVDTNVLVHATAAGSPFSTQAREAFARLASNGSRASRFQRSEFPVDTRLLQDCIRGVPALDMQRDSEAAIRDGTVSPFMTAVGRPPVFAIMIAQDPAKIAVEASH